jgi:hypothetical protein
MSIKSTKTIHDKYNTAITLDRNWGISTNVATDIEKRVFKKSKLKSRNKVTIEFRKLNKSINKTTNLVSMLERSSSCSKQRFRLPSTNNFIGVALGTGSKNEK